MKRLCTSALTALFCVIILSFPVVAVSPGVGDIIEFGGYDWRVIDVQDGRALLLSDKMLELRHYHDTWTDTTWETSDIRAYLNGEFFDSFSATDRARITQVTNTNPKNPWWGAPGGANTQDRIFLLSLDEVVRYFGDAAEREQTWGFYGAHSDKRIVKCINSSCWCHSETNGHWWWLRSPGYFSYSAANVRDDGYVSVYGYEVFYIYGGVRPALWLEMKQPADTGAGGAGAAAALFLVGAAVCVKSVRRK
jgi:hypothetical protein